MFRSMQKTGKGWMFSREKRLIDLAVAGGVSPIAGPVGGLALAISRVVDGKGAIYRGKRIGQGGQEIEFPKIRTMRKLEPGELDTKPSERITKFGSIIRPPGIDEIPQLGLVLEGKLSIVGIRSWTDLLRDDMEAVLTRNEFDEAVEIHNSSRHGIVSPHHLYNRAGVHTEQWLRDKYVLDKYLAENTSFQFDTQLIGKSIQMILWHGARALQQPEAATENV